MIDSDTTPVKAQTVGRFAPTPSGRMHVGNVFAALLAWLAVRSEGGRLVLRIEDLDPRAQNPEAAQLLMGDLQWLGLYWDEGPYYQSRRGDLYAEALDTLRAKGVLYPCFCTRSELHAATAPHASDGTYVYPGTCRNLTPAQVAQKRKTRNPATRIMVPDELNPQGTIRFNDLGYGPQTQVLATECGDFLVQRSDGVVAYQLAVVVDDALMGVTQVVRGHDLLGSVGRQIYLQRLLGFREPTYGHIPLLMAQDGHRLSKREHDLDLGAIRARGTSATTLIGKLASLIGLAEPGEQVTPTDLIKRFDWGIASSHRNDIVISDEFGSNDLL